jgi:hypothetical protein
MTQFNAIGRRRAAAAKVVRPHAAAPLIVAEPLEPRQLFAAVAPPKSEPLNNGGVTFTGGVGSVTPTRTPTPTTPRPSAGAPFPVVAPPASDEDDQIVEATKITLGQEINDHAIGYDTDVDMFAITLTKGQIIGIDVDDFANYASFDGVLRIFDGAGKQLDTSDDDVGPDPETADVEPYIADFIVPTTGTYYIGVSGAGNAKYDATLGTKDDISDFGPYILSTVLLGEENDIDDQIGEARSTTAHYTRDDTISNLTDVDMFRITASKAGDRFMITATARGAGLPLDSALQVFDANGNIVSAKYGGNTMISFVAPKKGNYYVGVSGNDNVDYDPFLGAYDDDSLGSTGAYRLKIDKI